MASFLRVAPAVGDLRASGPAGRWDSRWPSLGAPVGPPGGRSPAALSTMLAFSRYITVSSPSGGAGGRWLTSFRAFKTNRASGQPPATPRRSGWPSKRNITSLDAHAEKKSLTESLVLCPFSRYNRHSVRFSGLSIHRCPLLQKSHPASLIISIPPFSRSFRPIGSLALTGPRRSDIWGLCLPVNPRN